MNPIQRQIELVQAMVEPSFAPIDAVFDLFERTVRTTREPGEIAKGLAGIRRRDR